MSHELHINQVLDLSKIEAGELQLNPATVNLAPLIGEVIGTARQLAKPACRALAEYRGTDIAAYIAHGTANRLMREANLDLVSSRLQAPINASPIFS